MAHSYAINDDVHHQVQGPQGRAVVRERSVYTIVSRLPIEADGRPRYRIKSKTENVGRVGTEEQTSRLGWSDRAGRPDPIGPPSRFTWTVGIGPVRFAGRGCARQHPITNR